MVELKESLGRKPMQMALPQTAVKPVAKPVEKIRATKETRDTNNPLHARFVKLHKKRTLTWFRRQDGTFQWIFNQVKRGRKHMKISELIAKLQNVLEKDGDVDTYGHDMNSVTLELCGGGGTEDKDSPTYGKAYLCIG